jgi:hypothetical protein
MLAASLAFAGVLAPLRATTVTAPAASTVAAAIPVVIAAILVTLIAELAVRAPCGRSCLPVTPSFSPFPGAPLSTFTHEN